ncbi:AraC-like DNA-binding protein [Paenibacillus anaericanus]|uniref:AraC family transcriptional regulator n=1 Tax=Paenibacillus anaericanus TaxID=170367 RepID=A0A3S1DHY0_9BACL|nr:AraC family transcriptional regulator [Paenibacillus anaericanus]MDQ0089557.1 AraC-like DNA-binding protein [Paenibacillus anaericanus]RUT38610.1 AraC family transcriptional regulator [Paenibacillus anaericanus]
MGNVRYWLPGERRGEIPARLLYVSSSIYEGDWFSLRHSHNFSELFYVRSGRGNFIVEDEIFPVKQDDLVIVNPNVEHTEVSISSDPLEYVVLGVEGMSFDFGDRSGSRNHEIINYRNQRDELLFYFNALLRETENKDENYEAICQNLLEVVVISLMRSSGHPFSVVATQRANKICSRIKRYIDSNYAEEISLDSLAEKAHLSKYYLVHTFAKYYDMSPINYLNEVRLRASKELLETTDLSISQVAESTGFSSQSYFSQSFRRSCGLTPSDYRVQTKKQVK